MLRADFHDSEREVREAVADLNDRILQWRRIPLGPPVYLPLLDQDTMLARWHAAHPSPPPSPASPSPVSPSLGNHTGTTATRRRWWHRLTRRTP